MIVVSITSPALPIPSQLLSTDIHPVPHQESLKRQLKLILDIDPKTPGESLAKELRQVGKNISSRYNTFLLEISPFMTDPWQKN